MRLLDLQSYGSFSFVVVICYVRTQLDVIYEQTWLHIALRSDRNTKSYPRLFACTLRLKTFQNWNILAAYS